MNDETYPKAYYDGRGAREAHDPKHAPAYLSRQGRSWWLAGWNDRDIEKTRITR